VRDKKLVDDDYVIHFPIKMKEAWDNVIYTCSVMLLFRNEMEVEEWCERSGIPKGDVQSAAKIFEFAGEWYGRHRSENWVKWNLQEACEIFERHGLNNEIWQIASGEKRF